MAKYSFEFKKKVVMEYLNGEIISYSIAENLSAKNMMDALKQAIIVTSDCPYLRTFHQTGVGYIR